MEPTVRGFPLCFCLSSFFIFLSHGLGPGNIRRSKCFLSKLFLAMVFITVTENNKDSCQFWLLLILMLFQFLLLKTKCLNHYFYYFNIIYVYGWFACTFVLCVPGASRGQKRVLNPLGLELEMIVSTLRGHSWKSATGLNC